MDRDERRNRDERQDQDERMDQDGRESRDEPRKAGADKPKPIPIRESVGETGPRPAGGSDARGNVPKSQAPGLRGQRERPQGPRGKGASRKSERSTKRRTHRRGEGSDREGAQRPPLQPTAIEDLPTRSFEHDGCEWIARLCGETTSGSVRDLGAPLMHLVFYRSAEPLVSCGEVVVPGRSLEELPELRLSELVTKVGSALSPNESSR